jgi:hypothetical protein
MLKNRRARPAVSPARVGRRLDQFSGRHYQAGCRRPVHLSCGIWSGSVLPLSDRRCGATSRARCPGAGGARLIRRSPRPRPVLLPPLGELAQHIARRPPPLLLLHQMLQDGPHGGGVRSAVSHTALPMPMRYPVPTGGAAPRGPVPTRPHGVVPWADRMRPARAEGRASAHRFQRRQPDGLSPLLQHMTIGGSR